MAIASFADPRNHGRIWAAATPGPLSLVLVVLGAACLAFRRRAPIAVLAATSTVSPAELFSGEPRAPVAMSAVIATPSPPPPTGPPPGASACSRPRC